MTYLYTLEVHIYNQLGELRKKLLLPSLEGKAVLHKITGIFFNRISGIISQWILSRTQPHTEYKLNNILYIFIYIFKPSICTDFFLLDLSLYQTKNIYF